MKDKLYSNRITLLKAGALGLLPLLCCVMACAMQGKSIFDIYLPASEWNDELFYFKQVEAMLSHGYPRGYFGFNESHALKLSFAAWSPVLVWPWLLWGLLFGWNLMSPILCNVAVMTVAVVVFVLLVKPGWKQTGLLALLFCTFTPFVNYMLRGMPEAICFAMVIVYYALFLRQQEKEDVLSLVLLFVFAGVMTLMRPYLVLFYIYPMYRWIRKQRWIGVLGSVLSLGVVLGGYFAIKYYLGAEYFTPLFQTEWLTPFTEGHIWQGIKGTVSKLFSNGGRFVALTKEGFISGLAEGAYFGGYIAMLMLFAWQMFYAFRKKDKKKILEYTYMTFCFVGMLVALLLMYKMKEGSKHLITFMAMGVFVVAMMETKLYKKAVFLGVICVYLYSVKATSEMDYALPFANDERVEQMEYWEATFNSKLVLTESEDISYENTVIWVFTDEVRYENVLTDWQILYALPEGFGISCCYNDYAIENFDNLKSKYITIPAGSMLEKMCVDAGYTQIGTDERVAVYEVNKTYEQLISEMEMEYQEREAEGVFLSMVPMRYDFEENFVSRRGRQIVQGDFSDFSYEEWYMALEKFVYDYAPSCLYLWMEPQFVDTAEFLSMQELFANAPDVKVEIVLDVRSAEELATIPIEDRETVYEGYRQIVNAFAVDENVVYFLGDRQWFVENGEQYLTTGAIERDFAESLMMKMFCDRQFATSTDLIEGQLIVLEEMVLRSESGEAEYEKRKNDVYVFFGDSIMGDVRDASSVPNVVAHMLGANVYNMGLGGVSVSGEIGESLNGVTILDEFISGERVQISEENALYGEIVKWQRSSLSSEGELVFFVSYGINDYFLGKKIVDYKTALGNMVDTLRVQYPSAKVVLMTPTYIHMYGEGTQVFNEDGNVFADYVGATKEVSVEKNVILLDAYQELGVNAENASEYLVDEVHHNEQGRYMLADLISSKIDEIVEK